MTPEKRAVQAVKERIPSSEVPEEFRVTGYYGVKNDEGKDGLLPVLRVDVRLHKRSPLTYMVTCFPNGRMWVWKIAFPCEEHISRNFVPLSSIEALALFGPK